VQGVEDLALRTRADFALILVKCVSFGANQLGFESKTCLLLSDHGQATFALVIFEIGSHFMTR
jgi:hypothetical protein